LHGHSFKHFYEREKTRSLDILFVFRELEKSLKGPLNGYFSYVVQSSRKRITYHKLDVISKFNEFENDKVSSKRPFFNELGTMTMLEKAIF
jgi:hypothetical protein